MGDRSLCLQDVETRLAACGVNMDYVRLGGRARAAEGVFVIMLDQLGWCTFYVERGVETDLQRFDDEAAACLYFVEWLCGMDWLKSRR